MWRFAGCLLVPFLLVSSPVWAQTSPEAAAESYLQLLSQGRYSEAYDALAPQGKREVSKEQFSRDSRSRDAMLGKLLLRNISANPPQQQDSFVVDYRSKFSKIEGLLEERVNLVKDSSGNWRVFHYAFRAVPTHPLQAVDPLPPRH